MKKALILIAGVAVASAAWADPIQFVILHRDGAHSYASIAPVMVNERTGTRPLGYTDAYGRIQVNLPPGGYELSVNVRGTQFRTMVQITGTTSLRTVMLQ
jgi:hypothetical protein